MTDQRIIIHGKPYIMLYLSATLCFEPIYNMVGVAVAMVITTMHEKSCIDLHNAWQFEKYSKM